MSKKYIDDAIYNTYIEANDLSCELGKVQILKAIREYIRNGETKYFTNKNSEKKNLYNNVGPEDLARYLATEFYSNAFCQENLNENDAYLKLLVIADESR